MPDFNTSVEIEPWEFVEQCSSSDIEDLIDSLVDGGHLDKFNGAVKSVDSHNTILNDEWFELIKQIYNNNKEHIHFAFEIWGQYYIGILIIKILHSYFFEFLISLTY